MAPLARAACAESRPITPDQTESPRITKHRDEPDQTAARPRAAGRHPDVESLAGGLRMRRVCGAFVARLWRVCGALATRLRRDYDAIRTNSAKYVGNVLPTHFGSLIVTGTPPKLTSEKHMAMR